jgi:hypothetical protein
MVGFQTFSTNMPNSIWRVPLSFHGKPARIGVVSPMVHVWVFRLFF